jgi:hypothetical protein
MKKLLFGVLCVFAFAAGVGAQFRFYGNFQTGAYFHATDEEDVTPTMSMYHSNSRRPVRIELVGVLNSWEAPFGLMAILASDFASYNATTPPVPRPEFTWFSAAYGWTNLLDGKMRVYGGYIDKNDEFSPDGGIAYTLRTDRDDADLAVGPGFFVVARPLEKLKIGAAAYLNQMENSDDWDLGQYNLYGAYDFDFMNIRSGFRTHTLGSGENVHNTSAFLGLQLKMLRPLGFSTVNLDVYGFNLGEDFIKDSGSLGYLETGQRIIWIKNNLEIGGRFAQRFLMGDQTKKEEYLPDLNFWLWGAYKITDKMTPRLDAVYILGSNPKNDRWMPEYLYWYEHNKHKAGFYIRPSVRIDLTANSHFWIGYIFLKDLSYYKEDVDVYSTMDHLAYFEYRINW